MTNYQDWIKTIKENFPEIGFETEVCMSVISQLLIEDIRLPFGLVLIGAPATYKTTILSFFDEAWHKDFFFHTDSFTPKSFVSHVADRRKSEDLEKIDLLPKIRDKVLIVEELAPLFGQNEEKLLDTMSLLIRVMDGRGLTTESGVHGHRGYRGAYKFMFLGASTPIPYRVWNLMGNLGTKLYFLQLPKTDVNVDEIAELLSREDYAKNVANCTNATNAFIDTLKSKPIIWDKTKDPIDVRKKIVQLAILLSRLRGAVNVNTREEMTEDGRKEIVNYTTPLIENPTRAAIMLYNLARGHALVQGRVQINESDLTVLTEVTLSSAPQDRVETFNALLENNGQLTTTELMETIRCSRATALRTMNVLEILDLVEESVTVGQAGHPEKIVKLKPEFSWFLSEEFKKLRRHQPRPRRTKTMKQAASKIDEGLKIFAKPINLADLPQRE